MGKPNTKKNKQPRTASKFEQTVPYKFSRNLQNPNSDHEKLSWQVYLLDFGGPWGWDNLDADTLKYIHGKLAQFETMTWAEINHPNTGCHPIKLKELGNEAQKRLTQIKLIGVEEELFSLRLSGRERLWGIRERHIFKILWWDPRHEIYPVAKKHT